MSADARRNETQTYVPCMTVDDNITVNAVHVDDECTVNDEVACAARTTTDECTVEVNVHAVHLRCTVNDEMVFTDRVQRLWSQFM